MCDLIWDAQGSLYPRAKFSVNSTHTVDLIRDKKNFEHFVDILPSAFKIPDSGFMPCLALGTQINKQFSHAVNAVANAMFYNMKQNKQQLFFPSRNFMLKTNFDTIEDFDAYYEGIHTVLKSLNNKGVCPEYMNIFQFYAKKELIPYPSDEILKVAGQYIGCDFVRVDINKLKETPATFKPQFGESLDQTFLSEFLKPLKMALIESQGPLIVEYTRTDWNSDGSVALRSRTAGLLIGFDDANSMFHIQCSTMYDNEQYIIQKTYTGAFLEFICAYYIKKQSFTFAAHPYLAIPCSSLVAGREHDFSSIGYVATNAFLAIPATPPGVQPSPSPPPATPVQQMQRIDPPPTGSDLRGYWLDTAHGRMCGLASTSPSTKQILSPRTSSKAV